MAEFDSYQKEPGLYMTEAASPPPPPTGIAVGTGAMMGVAQWGPIDVPMLVTSFAQWVRLFGNYISSTYPSYKQVKKFFKNGGARLWFKRIVHFTDITDRTTKVSLPAIGYIYDSLKTPASIADPVAGGSNAGDDTAAKSGTYTGTQSGTFRVKVTTAGAYGVGVVTIYFTPSGGSEVTVGTEMPASGTPFEMDNGAMLALTDGGDTNLTLDDEWTIAVTAEAYTTADRRIAVTALYDGSRGNDITIDVAEGSLGVSGEFKLTVLEGGELAEPSWDNLSLDVDAPNYFKSVVNGNSRFVILDEVSGNINPVGTPQTATMAGGDDGLTGLVASDYIGDPEAETGIQAFRVATTEPINIGCPDTDMQESATIRKEMARFVDNDMVTSFAILVMPKGKTPDAAITYQNATLTTDSPRSAIYYPWVIDEDDNEVISPLGALMGLYARYASDINKGIWWSPAGTEARLLGIVGLERLIGAVNAGALNEKRVNCLKFIDTIGVVSWGSRTMAIAKAADFKYIGARLNTSDIEARVLKNTLWAPHRPNDQDLWDDVGRTCKSICNLRYLNGGLDGETKEEAYGVICDKTINTQTTKNKGLVVVRVGIRNKQTAEFIWFNVTQFASGGTITE